MIRVVGIDPGTVSIDVCGIVDGQLYLDRSWPTAEALSGPAGLVELLTTSGPPDLIVGPSGYGLPLRRAAEATETDLRLAFLAPPGETGGIGGGHSTSTDRPVENTGSARHGARSSHLRDTCRGAAAPWDRGR